MCVMKDFKCRDVSRISSSAHLPSPDIDMCLYLYIKYLLAEKGKTNYCDFMVTEIFLIMLWFMRYNFLHAP